MTKDQRESALVLLEALDVIEVAVAAYSAELAVPGVRAMVGLIPAEQLPAVATALAVEGVWGLPPAVLRPRTAGEVEERRRQVFAWVRRMRLEARWVAS